VGHTVSRGTLLEAITGRLIEVNAVARELLAKIPPEIEEEMLERVRDFLASESGLAREAIVPEATLVDDLGISGRAGVEVMARFFEAFEVSPTGFEVARYFGAQKIGLLGSISALMGEGTARRPLSVDDLVGAAMVRRWLA
jgi:acyl carrier protein